MEDAIPLYNVLAERPARTEWKFLHCWDILKGSLFVDYMLDAKKRDKVQQPETQTWMKCRARLRESEAMEARPEMEREARAQPSWQEQERAAGVRKARRARSRARAEEEATVTANRVQFRPIFENLRSLCPMYIRV